MPEREKDMHAREANTFDRLRRRQGRTGRQPGWRSGGRRQLNGRVRRRRCGAGRGRARRVPGDDRSSFPRSWVTASNRLCPTPLPAMTRVPLKPLRARRVDAFWLLLAAAFLAYLFVDNARRASLRIDGVRYFWLDDDMTISMRYARNLAHGLGLVWNPGQRVEGYTNFGWTLVMAVVHLFPIPDAQTALYVRGISFVCCVGA